MMPIMKKNVDGPDKLKAVMSSRNISRDTLSHLLNTKVRTVDDWISGKSKMSGLAEMIADELISEMEFPAQLHNLWALLSSRYERTNGKPVPRKGERRKQKKRSAEK
jgi:hypothetical protein